MTVSPLPPLNLFAVFECAARHLSFTRAAQELNVQQPAVSRHIAALEEALQTALFVRTRPLLGLTREGQDLQVAVSAGLASIRQCVDGLRASQQRNVLVVNAALGFTSLYLMPRLGAFQAANPDINLEVVTRDQNAGFDPDASDIVVTFGDEALTGSASCCVVEEELYAMCVPTLLEDGRPFTDSELVQQRLLGMTSHDHVGDWARYLDGSGFAPPTLDTLDRFYSFMVYLHAIQNGNGIGLGWVGLTDELVHSGRLAIASERTVCTGRGYHCCVMPHATHRPEAQLFLDWLEVCR